MALLSFPTSPTNGQLYPTSPISGQNQYEWDAANQTWRLLGAGTGVTTGTYGDASNVGQFTVDAQGRITSAANVPIASGAGGTVTAITAGTGLTGGTITASGTIALDTTYTDARYVQTSDLPLDIAEGGTGQVTANDALNALLPDQTSETGKYLVTDGTDASWAASPALPSQTGQGGGYLTTNGTSAAWTSTSSTLLTQAVAPPTSSTAPGVRGNTASDANYFYYYDGFGWKRTPWDPSEW